MISLINIYVMDIVWILCDVYEWRLKFKMFIWFCKAYLRICWVVVFIVEVLNAKNWKLDFSGKYQIFHSTANFGVLRGENMASKKWKIVCSVNVSRLEFVSPSITGQLQPNFHKLLPAPLKQRITKLHWKSTMYSVVKCP